jgi:hypothetical protein
VRAYGGPDPDCGGRNSPRSRFLRSRIHRLEISLRPVGHGLPAAWEEYKKDGYLPIDIEMDNGGADYSGVWQKNTDGRDWISLRRQTDEQFHTRWDEYRKKGYILIDQDSEVIGGKLLYSLIMVEKQKDSTDQIAISRANTENFAANKKYRPIDTTIEVGGQVLYSII